MSTLPTIDSGTLGWVKSEIEDTALQARNLLQTFEADASDRSAMRLCANHLHQVYGTLTMVELDGAARMVHEAESLAQKLADGTLEWSSQCGSALRRAIDDLSSYLEGLQSPPVPSPLQLIEPINRVREARGDSPVPELELFAPDLSARPPEARMQTGIDAGLFLKLADDLRLRFERALLRVLRDPGDRTGLGEFQRVFNNLVTIDRRGSLRQLWWIGAGISEALLDGSLELDAEIRTILARINEQLKGLKDRSQTAKRRAPPDELIKRALLTLAYCDSSGPTIAEIRNRFGLDEWIRKGDADALPDVERLAAALARFAAQSEDDIKQAQNLLARYFSPQGGDDEVLARLSTRLETLLFAARDNELDVLARLIESLARIAEAVRDGEVVDLENASLQMAGALLFIQDCGAGVRPGVEWKEQAEASIASLQVVGSSGKAADDGVVDVRGSFPSPAGDDGARAAAAEVRAELQFVERILEQVANNETQIGTLRGVEAHLKRVEGTLEILDQSGAAALAERLRQTIRAAIDSGSLDPAMLDALAMAVGTLGVCADELREGGSTERLESTIERADRELSRVHHGEGGRQPARLELVPPPSLDEDRENDDSWVLEAPGDLFEMGSGTSGGADTTAIGSATDDEFDLEVDQESLPLAGVESPDGDLVDIFFEEAQELEGRIAVAKEAWRSNESDDETLGDLRRCFHTIKGSGRFAGANTIAELSWIVEDVLNAVIDKEIASSSALHDFVDRAHRMVAQLIDRRDIGDDLDLAPWRREASMLKIAGYPRTEELSADLGAELLELKSRRDDAGTAEAGDREPQADAEAISRGRGRVDAGRQDEIADVFLDELQVHVATIADSVANARRQFPAWEISDALLRTAHTLRGVLRSVGLDAPARMADCLDDLLHFKRRTGQQLEEVDLVLIDQSGRMLRLLAGRLGRELRLSPDLALQFDELASALGQRLQLLGSDDDRGSPIEPAVAERAGGAPPGARDDELVQAFREEGQEILDRLGQQIDRWRGGAPATEVLSALRRELHTFKGGARAVGWLVLGNLAHHTETLLEDEMLTATRRDTVSALVQEVHDTAAVAIASPAVDMTAEIAALDRKVVALGEGEPSAPTSAPTEADVDETPDSRAVEAIADVDTVLQPAPPPAFTEGESRAVRVRTEVLDDLVNYAGEVSILRSRLQQQIQMVKSNLGELGETVRVFRDQLRDLEIESEAQMLATSERIREEGGVSEFDPLELDRFSRLQTLSRQLGESLGNLISIQAGISEFAGDAENTLQQQRHLSESLQERLLRTRMISFVSVVPRLRHLIRQTATELGRRVDLEVTGEQVEVDRKVLDQMSASFEHMIRNAVSHGIEDAGERTASGKEATGLVRIALEQDGNDIVIRIADDGRGVDLNAIASRARALGLIKDDETVSEDALMRILAAPGLSTAGEITQVSGRGIGMDVVSETIRQLGGSIAVETTQGKGTTFILRVPVTLAVSHALLVYAGEQMFAVPARLIVNVLRIPRADLEPGDDDAEAYTFDSDRRIPVLNLADRLGLPSREDGRKVVNVVVVRAGLTEIGLWVESISDTREVVVKPLGPLMQSIPGISAVTLLGDGSIVLILDVPDLWQMRRVNVSSETFAVAPAISDGVTVMVVDDSMTVRSVMGRDLQNNGFEVILAKDGVDAIEQLRHAVPDILLVDLEMPRMDGFELTRRVREDENLRTVPILIITSRAGARHREQAMRLGASGYMSKPYRLDDLVRSINSLTGTDLQEQGLDPAIAKTLH